MIRLSNKAQDRVESITARLSTVIRTVASLRAERDGREFADLHDVNEAYRITIEEFAGEFRVHGSEIKRSCNEAHPGQDVHHPEGH